MERAAVLSVGNGGWTRHREVDVTGSESTGYVRFEVDGNRLRPAEVYLPRCRGTREMRAFPLAVCEWSKCSHVDPKGVEMIAGTDSPWVTPDQLADEFQVPLSTVYQWNHKGTGPRPHKIGRHVRYRRDEVSRWAEAQAAAGGAP